MEQAQTQTFVSVDDATLTTVIKKGRVYATVDGFEETASSYIGRKDAAATLAFAISKSAASLKDIAAAVLNTFGDGAEPGTFRIRSKEERAVDVLYTFKKKALAKELAERVNKLPEALKNLLVEEVVEVRLKPREGAAKALELLEPIDPTTAALFKEHLAPEISVKVATKSTL